MRFQRAIVVGASSGIGFELVKQLAGAGCKVAALARRSERLEGVQGVTAYRHDVTEFDSVPELFQTITKELGGLDLIVYCAGVMPEVGTREYSFEKDKRIIDVNVVGLVAWLDQAATRFENTKQGSIVALGSVAGDRGRSGQPVYNASKAFLATFMEALRNRLARYGVRVATIKPGPTRTEMTENLHLRNGMSAADVARFVLAKADKTGEHYVNPTHRAMFYVIKRIPSPIFRRLRI